MATGKEIRGKIKNFESTKKITKAMEMISVSKMRKAQDRMRAARPYTEKVRNIAAHLGQANPEYVHAFMKPNDAKSVGMIVVTTDKGLCGGLNTNVLRAVTNKLRKCRVPVCQPKRSPSAIKVWDFSIVLVPMWLQT
jgi:F-type H+-transporting ATPase subunit gamma